MNISSVQFGTLVPCFVSDAWCKARRRVVVLSLIRRQIEFVYQLLIHWRHDIKTLSLLLAVCACNPPATCRFPQTGPVMWTLMLCFLLAWNIVQQTRLTMMPMWRHYTGSYDTWTSENLSGWINDESYKTHRGTSIFRWLVSQGTLSPEVIVSMDRSIMIWFLCMTIDKMLD